MNERAVEQLKARHGFDDWRNRNTLAQGLFIHNFFPRDGLLPGFRLERLQQVPAEREIYYQSIWMDAAGDSELLVRMDVHACASRPAAHELVAQLLGGFQSPAIARDDSLAIGDICFSGPGGAAVVFARANLAVFVARVGAKPMPVVELARSF